VSLTVTVNEQEAVFPDPSVAVQVTVVTPLANVDPDAGAHSTVAPGQLSVASASCNSPPPCTLPDRSTGPPEPDRSPPEESCR